MNKKRLIINAYRLTILTLVIIYSLVFNYSIKAVSFSPTPSPTQDPAITEFQQKVEQIKQQAATQAAQFKSQVSHRVQNKAFIGTVAVTLNSQLTIQTIKNTTHTVKVDQYTVYQDNTSHKALTFNDIKKSDFLICLGDVDDNGNLKAKKIIRQKAPAPENKTAFWGQIQSILINTLSLLKNDGQKAIINIDNNTILNFGSREIAVSDLKAGNFIIAVGSLDKSNFNASFIYLLNPSGNLKFATSSASPSAKSSPAKK